MKISRLTNHGLMSMTAWVESALFDGSAQQPVIQQWREAVMQVLIKSRMREFIIFIPGQVLAVGCLLGGSFQGLVSIA